MLNKWVPCELTTNQNNCPFWSVVFPYSTQGFPSGSEGKESACNAGYPGSVPALGRFLEKGMATHSSILAWRIPWTEEPGRLQSMGSQRVRHDWATSTFTVTQQIISSSDCDVQWKLDFIRQPWQLVMASSVAGLREKLQGSSQSQTCTKK